MSTKRNTSISKRTANACLLAATLATLCHFAIVSSASRPLQRYSGPIGPLMDAGVRIPIAELWPSRDVERTAVLLLDIGCQACLVSRPFYGELARLAAETPGTGLVILSENPIPEVRKWLDEGGIGGRIVRIPSRMALGVLSTPTLLLANAEGVVTDIAVGTLDRADAARSKARMRGVAEAESLRLPYSLREMSVAASRDGDTWIGPQLVDTRDRDDFDRQHSPRAVNIPEDELEVRAPAELIPSRQVFVDCRFGNQADCRLAGGRLARLGFASVTVVLR